ncbi:histidinol-phosphatase [Burkholderia pseudomultivorans]|uniref:Phosphoserine phosphatase SerB1 n=1 Tax=Burkholderia pseudomultivorans TaxID=1207504 RepID=A0ABU2E3K1_9BURK|nr:HAD family hydrolase [Burkholderia pseudomultivorans]MDR8732138.1 Phosphoserine phosphatase SerB1 [Burkholderia pseudomultivorans]MDR8737047.1 Phosphoserine phosphatase SerB1 [Burkholderia pseudomultivorans]MDR8743058.1 Phosphoserine phosphatase SerB1 [Burkholderia pseudomultivorans]MDR8754432.1 Phosphoserine phosphatase SerB1 [Burkholderia pseudomultivorans]MDR8779785.1 Phosphoserine phosphatase SerB1 [Burkholderia pseudomultivorans]
MTQLALFDLDFTLIPFDSDQAWGRFMVEHGLVDAAEFERIDAVFAAGYAAGTLDIHAHLCAILAPLARHSRERLAQWHARFMDDVVRPAIPSAALELVRRHRARGDLCCVVTATNAFIARPIAHAFGIDALIACEPETVDGRPGSAYTGRPTGVPSYREGKIVRTDAWLASLGFAWSDFERSWFYSDSHNDVPLLETVTDAVATNPDERLRDVALARGWRIVELFETV